MPVLRSRLAKSPINTINYFCWSPAIICFSGVIVLIPFMKTFFMFLFIYCLLGFGEAIASGRFWGLCLDENDMVMGR